MCALQMRKTCWLHSDDWPTFCICMHANKHMHAYQDVGKARLGGGDVADNCGTVHASRE